MTKTINLFHHRSFRALLFLLAALLIGVAAAQAQAGTLTFDSQVVTCSSIKVTYTVNDASGEGVPTLVEAIINDSPLFSANGPGTNGQHMVTINFTPQAPGTPIHGQVSNGTSSDAGLDVPCGGGGNGNGDGNGDGNGQPAPPWSGFADGRLNPDPAEYYSIWCQSDQIQVWRAVPSAQLLKEISLAAVLALPVGGEMSLGDFMVLQRSSEDIVTIFGSNGNLAPEPGQKAFSLSACIASNGGAPEMPEDMQASNGQPPPSDTEQGRQQQETQETVDFCFDSYAFFGGDNELLADCLDFALATQQDGLTGVQVLSLLVMVFCLNIIAGMGVLPIGLIFLRRRRNRAAEIDRQVERMRRRRG